MLQRLVAATRFMHISPVAPVTTPYRFHTPHRGCVWTRLRPPYRCSPTAFLCRTPATAAPAHTFPSLPFQRDARVRVQFEPPSAAILAHFHMPPRPACHAARRACTHTPCYLTYPQPVRYAQLVCVCVLPALACVFRLAGSRCRYQPVGSVIWF